MTLAIGLPKYPSCGEETTRKNVPVDERVLACNPYSVSYCPRCEVYVTGRSESRSAEEAGRVMTCAQIEGNLRNNDSPYGMHYLKRLE
jgi:hypothetical protein